VLLNSEADRTLSLSPIYKVAGLELGEQSRIRL